jgi:hypothetical protein
MGEPNILNFGSHNTNSYWGRNGVAKTAIKKLQYD